MIVREAAAGRARVVAEAAALAEEARRMGAAGPEVAGATAAPAAEVLATYVVTPAGPAG